MGARLAAGSHVAVIGCDSVGLNVIRRAVLADAVCEAAGRAATFRLVVEAVRPGGEGIRTVILLDR